MKVRRYLVCGALPLLFGCNGQSKTPGSVSASPTPTATASPTPFPSATPNGTVATVETGVAPGLTENDAIGNFRVTSTGIYFSVSRQGRTQEIGKLRGDVTQTASWRIAKPSNDTEIVSFAPAFPYSEFSTDISVFYSGTRTDGLAFGFFSTIRGVSYESRNSTPSDRITAIPQVASGPFKDASAPPSNPWIAAQESGGTLSIYRDRYTDNGRASIDGPPSIAARFPTPAAPPLSGTKRIDRMVSHPFDPLLYVGYDSEIWIYDADKLLDKISFAEKGYFNDLIWSDALYASIGSGIYRIGSNRKSNKILELPASFINNNAPNPGRFCIAAGRIFLASGEAFVIESGKRYNWISTGTLSPNQSTEVASINEGLKAGIYCSDQMSSPIIWTPAPTSKIGLRTVTPLPG
jgi:hypothetical protein